MNAGIEVSTVCNFKCVHCYHTCSDRDSVLSKEQIFSIIDKLFDFGILDLYFTGGEVFLRPNFLEIYTYAKKKGFIIGLLTKGSLIDNRAIEVFKKYPPYAINITVYGGDERSHIETTGTNSLGKVLENTESLIQSDIFVNVRYFILSTNDYARGKFKKSIGEIENRVGKEIQITEFCEIFEIMNSKGCKNHSIPKES